MTAHFTPSSVIRVLTLGLALSLGACATKPPDPSPLEALPSAPSWQLSRLWSAHVQAVVTPAALNVRGQTLLLADGRQDLQAINVDTGATLARISLGAPLATNPGTDGHFVAVVSTQNELIVLDGAKPLWHTRLPSQVVTPPLVAGERVFVLTTDRSVYALDAQSGRKLWSYQRPNEPLALRQPGVLVAVGDELWAGVGARLMALDPTTGEVKHEVVVGTPRGSNEVERLADLVAPAARVDDPGQLTTVVCVRSFQLSVACLDSVRHALIWANPQTGLVGVGADLLMVVGGDAADRLAAWSLNKGQALWRNEHFAYRGLSSPVVMPDAVVVGDALGYLHVLDRQDGHTISRVSMCSSAVVALRRNNDHVLGWCRDGTISAYTLKAGVQP